jgi:arylsulfatase A-like enzyme
MRKVLFISADQWRWECLSALGHKVVRTPNLDALAADGVLFRNHFAQACPCGPARASMLTGLYLMNHRSGRNGTPLDARFTNLALEARKAGYDPTLFGYTDTSPDPRGRDPRDPALTTYEGVMPGFSVGLQLPNHMAPWIADLSAKGYDIPGGRRDVYKAKPNYPGAAERGQGFAPPVFTAEDSETAFMTDQVLRYLSVRQDSPWFVHLAYLRPHPPLIAPEPYNTLYDPAAVALPIRAASPDEEGRIHPYLAHRMIRQTEVGLYTDHPVNMQALGERDLRQLRATYYGLITQVDEAIGRLVAYLKATGEYETTLIVFTVDHGEMLGDHWIFGKEGFHDATYHIPLIICDPRREADRGRGRVVEEFTEAVDIMPTILAWLGHEAPLGCDGESLLPFLVGDSPAGWRREARWEYDFRDIPDQVSERALDLTSDQCCLAVIRDHDWKYVHFPALPPLLFDLRHDPDEFVNLADDPGYREVALLYARKMLSWRMTHAERTLTRLHLTEKGVTERRGPRW